MILRLLCALWPSPFSWCPSDLWVFNFPHPRLQQTVVMLLYLLIPTWVVALPWNGVAAATNIGNCLCWWHPGLRNQECSGHQGHEPQWCLYPSLAPRGALSTHKTLALSSFIPACLSSAWGRAGESSEWQIQSWSQNWYMHVIFLFLGMSHQSFKYIQNLRQNEAHPYCLLVTFGRNTVKWSYDH